MPSEPAIVADKKQIGKEVEIGPDVIIEANKVTIGDNVAIGSMNDEESFRVPGGVRVKAETLTIGNGAKISRGVLIKGGKIDLGQTVTIREYCTIDARLRFVLGSGSYLNPNCRVHGRDIEIGSNFRMLTWSSIGGGSCFDVHSKLHIGKNCHLGEFSFINTAEEVYIGDEVGIGMRSAIFTHGAYQSFVDGFPVTFGPITIEDNCWLPQAIVLPNVTIGKGTVVATGSLINKDMPEYSLVGGIPAKVIREGGFSTPPDRKMLLSLMDGFLKRLVDILIDVFGEDETGRSIDGWTFGGGKGLWFIETLTKETIAGSEFSNEDVVIALSSQTDPESLKDVAGCFIIIDERIVAGNTDAFAKRVLNQLRRYGVRFD